MGLLLMDGFDVYNGVSGGTGLTAKWTVNGLSMTTGRFGGQAVRVVNNPWYFFKAFTGFPSISLGYAHRSINLAANGGSTGAFQNAMLGANGGMGNGQVGFRANSDGSVNVSRVTNSQTVQAILATSAPGVIIQNVWHYIELSVLVSATVGTVLLKVDGATIFNLTNVNTKGAASFANIDTVAFGSDGFSPCFVDVDDVYVVDGTVSLGERRIQTLYPNSNVASGFTPLSGVSNFAMVNEAIVDSDTSYVQASVVGTLDNYGIGSLTGTPAVIDAVNIMAFSEKTDATTRAIALQVKSGASVTDGPNFFLPSAYAKQERLLLTDPNTAAAWTAAAVNALNIGPKVTT